MPLVQARDRNAMPFVFVHGLDSSARNPADTEPAVDAGFAAAISIDRTDIEATASTWPERLIACPSTAYASVVSISQKARRGVRIAVRIRSVLFESKPSSTSRIDGAQIDRAERLIVIFSVSPPREGAASKSACFDIWVKNQSDCHHMDGCRLIADGVNA
jgi:hypothetical protein